MPYDSYARAALMHRAEFLAFLKDQEDQLVADLQPFETAVDWLLWIQDQRDALTDLLYAQPAQRAKLLAKLPPNEARLRLFGAAYMATEAHSLLAQLYLLRPGMADRDATAIAATIGQAAADAAETWLIEQPVYRIRWQP